jgi:hypothetical protein
VWGAPMNNHHHHAHPHGNAGNHSHSSSNHQDTYNNNDNNNYDYDDNDNGYAGNNDNDNDYRTDFNFSVTDDDHHSQVTLDTAANGHRPIGLEINTNNLLKASRTIDKVEIGYATVSTKVNVRKLKSDIWEHIHKSSISRRNTLMSLTDGTLHNTTLNNTSTTTTTTTTTTFIDTENVNPLMSSSLLDTSSTDRNSLLLNQSSTTLDKSNLNKSGVKGSQDLISGLDSTATRVSDGMSNSIMSTSSLSFRHLISSVSQKQEQSNVSLPFYFICLLHLANEKVRD